VAGSFLGNINRNRLRHATALPQFCHRRIALTLIPPGDHHCRTGINQTLGHPKSDPAVAAGYREGDNDPGLYAKVLSRAHFENR
jgi:hypothetical protein